MSGRPAVIIPSYNGAQKLTEALASLRQQTVEHTVVVVDNGSTDSTPSVLQESFPEVRVVRLSSNVGFARAVNRGVSECDEATIVFLNNDVLCEPPFVERLCAALEPGDGIVMAAGVLLSWTQPGRIDSAGVMFDRTLLAFDHLHGEPIEILEHGPPNPLGPTGGAAALDRSAFEAVGGFDEQFFAYLEDVDLVARILASGGRCRLEPKARALHRHSSTLGPGSRRKHELMGWSRGYIIGKYRLHRRPRLLARALLAELVITSGQVALDRTAIGFRARAAGLRSGLAAPDAKLPPLPPSALRVTVADALRRRLRRRRLAARH